MTATRTLDGRGRRALANVALGETKADTVVRVSASGDLEALAMLLKNSLEGVSQANVVEETVVVHVKGATGLLPKIISAAESGGFSVADLSASEPTLETVFISLTGKDLRE